jgi:arsenite-transporting ATPase
MRTFTYLNLYGYLSDAVIVNKVFPDEVGEYFSAWRERQEEHLELVHSAFAPVPVLTAPYFEQEVLGAGMLDRLTRELFDTPGREPAAVLHESPAQSLVSDEHGATLRLPLPMARKEEISLKQVGLELIVTVPGQRRTIILPSSMAGYHPSGARFDDGALEVSFARAG